MRILIVYPDDKETGPGLVHACERAGHEAGFVDAKLAPWGMFQHINAKHGEYDLVLMSRTLELYPDFVRSKQRYPKIKFAMWNVDVRKNLSDWGLLIEFIRELDYYFTVGLGVVADWQKINPQSYFLTQGIQEERYHKTIPTEEQIKKYSCDVSFIGSLSNPTIHRERRYLLETLRHSIYDVKHFEGIYGDEHNAAVSCARINLGITHSPDVACYVSVRDWKIIAAQGVLLEQKHPGLHGMFGGRVALYENPGDCISKIGEILSDYDNWRQKALKLWEWGMATQCYKDRIDEIVGLIESGL